MLAAKPVHCIEVVRAWEMLKNRGQCESSMACALQWGSAWAKRQTRKCIVVALQRAHGLRTSPPGKTGLVLHTKSTSAERMTHICNCVMSLLTCLLELAHVGIQKRQASVPLPSSVFLAVRMPKAHPNTNEGKFLGLISVCLILRMLAPRGGKPVCLSLHLYLTEK